MKVPSFKSKKIRNDILELVNLAPTRGMYEIVLKSIDLAMDDLVEIRQSIPTDNSDVYDALKDWDNEFNNFGEREAYYYDSFLKSLDRTVVDGPLFAADYSRFDFDNKPDYPDIETPWRLANGLVTILVAAGATQDSIDDLEERFKGIISEFWLKANSLIVEKKLIYEEELLKENKGLDPEGGVVFGFWPVIAAGAAALVGAFGLAAGYSAYKGDSPDDYVERTPFEKHLKTAKTVGVGMIIGAVIAIMFMFKRR